MTAITHLLDRTEFDTNAGCWLWALSCGSHGYGQVVIDGEHELAHRASWKVHFGPIPDGVFVLHRCDVRPCIRPDHLFLGTAEINTADMWAKGRESAPPRMLGAENKAAILTEIQVLEIRGIYHWREATQTALAKAYGVSQTQIWSVVRRKSWTHI